MQYDGTIHTALQCDGNKNVNKSKENTGGMQVSSTGDILCYRKPASDRKTGATRPRVARNLSTLPFYVTKPRKT